MSTSRPFRILGLQQIAVGSTDKAALRRLWVDLFGLQAKGSFRSESENVDEDITVMGAGVFEQLDLLVLPSRSTYTWAEQLGRVLLEAMASGVPVVGSSSGSIPEARRSRTASTARRPGTR